ncbi:hypothetical protein TPHA_0J02790 [Tetrapisispora phaffii CBS 4417]|uniref:Uncharacterized protein n=1 Tax=Tetrapisispora phaffii (strain ATCC 24235 / CBS 4417 / NBRC 1672 / NRRL Y-8282 / UCD 70-5) TaxID=1071381 RepID=G8BZ08_TETPH|nr:hypothetical protein TPHA_0J02790 [Tetrapisispora phaffii CBS 4417]CCE65100.1 hypothetical protein TPHA_0J02790 [Tetrapisispora phaffii CBS 4417]
MTIAAKTIEKEGATKEEIASNNDLKVDVDGSNRVDDSKDDEVDDDDDDDDDEDDDDDDDDDNEDDDHASMIAQSELSSVVGTPTGDFGKSDAFHDDKKRKLDESSPDKNAEKPNSEMTNRSDISNGSNKPVSTKMSTSVLERRRLGRQRAAAAYAIKLQKTGIEKKENDNIQSTGLFRPIPLVNQKNCSSDYLKTNSQIFALRERKVLRNNTNIININSGNNSNSTSGTTANTPEVSDLKNVNSESNVSLIDETILKNNPDNIVFDDPTTTIVIHPGSRYLKIGFAKDDSPLVIPNCVAFPKNSLYSENVEETIVSKEESDNFKTKKNQIQQSFRDRMRYYKRKIQNNSHERVRSFNIQSKPEKVEDKTEYNRVEWITNPDKIYYGEEASRCSKDAFIIRYPFVKGGSFNITSPYYNSLPEIIGDISNLFEYALSQDRFNLKPSEYSKYKIILVIPDIFEKSHLETMFRVLLKEMKFQAVAIMQESLAASYGAGIGGATCIVNIGATQTRVACIDEGTVSEHSLITLDYGGDDITKLFLHLLLQNEFPYQDLDINSSHGWRQIENLKKQFVTFEDANITVQLYNFIKNKPGAQAEKLEFKVFDEVINAPLGLFYPEIFRIMAEENEKRRVNKKLQDQLPPSTDLYTEERDDWRSLSQVQCLDNDTYSGNDNDLDVITKLLNANLNLDDMDLINNDQNENEKNYTSLDKAIIQSITNAVVTMDTSKMTQFYNNIMVVGGSSSIPSLDFILTDRINIWRPRILSSREFPSFFRNLVKQVKDFNTANKSNNRPEEGEEEQKKGIAELIKTELKKYKDNLESQNANEHLLPVSVLPPPADMDPSVLNWKGASVLGQLKLIEELYVTNADWDMLGSRILQYKCLFPY